MNMIADMFRWIADTMTQEVVGAFVTALVIGLLFESWRIVRAAARRIGGFFGARKKLLAFDREIARIRRRGRWSMPVGRSEQLLQRQIAGSKPILLIANHKGGVGKTTLALNLGAYFAIRRNMRVLFIDLDFQGTLSSTLVSMKALTGDESSRGATRRSW